MGVPFHRGPLGNRREFVYWEFWEIVGGLQKRCISLTLSLSVGALLGEPREGLLFWGFRRIRGGGLRGRTSPSVETLLGNLAGGLFTGDLRRLWRWAPFSTVALLRIMGGPFTGNGDSWKGPLEMGYLSPWALCEGNQEGLGATFIEEPEGYVEDDSGDGHLFP